MTYTKPKEEPTFTLFNHLHVRCNECKHVTALMPGKYTKLESECDCLENSKNKRKSNANKKTKTTKSD